MLVCLDISACALPLGMADGRIADTQLSESSRKLGGNVPRFGRLNGYGGWCADSWSTAWKTSFFQVEFDRKTRISGIATQGKDPGSSWVTRYHLKYKDLNNEFTWHNGKKVFTGNSNTDEVVRNDLEESFVTRAVQVVPSEYHRWPCLRMELYGCEVEEEN